MRRLILLVWLVILASIDRRPNGAYRVRWRDADGVQHAHHERRKTDAKAFEAQVKASLITGAYVNPRAGRMTFGTFYTDWAGRQVWETNTREAMDLAVRSSRLSDVPIGSIRRARIETWVKRMTAEGLAPGTIATRVRNVRAVFRAAVRDRVIPEDPAAQVKIPRVRRAEAAMVIPTPAEVAALVSGAGELRAAVALAAFAGLRVGEVLGVQIGDVAFLGRTLTVARQAQRSAAGLEIRPPKYGSERTVSLPDGLVTMLGAHVERLPARTSGAWLFPGLSDPAAPMHRSTLTRRWREAREAAGTPAVKFHDLRHFYASGLIAAGCDVVTVQRAMGHRSAAITLSTYAHLWPRAEDRTRAAAAGMMAVASTSEDHERTEEA